MVFDFFSVRNPHGLVKVELLGTAPHFTHLRLERDFVMILSDSNPEPK